MVPDANFTVVLRGYDRDEVDQCVRQIQEALASGDRALRDQVRRDLPEVAFRSRLRGYDVREVDDYIEQAEARLATG